MILTLFARRTTAAVAHVPRRTFFASARLSFPAEPSPAKTAGKDNKPPKRGRPPGNPPAGASMEKQPNKKIRIPKELKPPKNAPTPFCLFYTHFIKSQPKQNSKIGIQEMAKRAGEIWNGYSIAEKQPFYDESEARKAQAQQEREEFLRKTSISDLRELNAKRKAQGKRKYHFKGLRQKLWRPFPANPYILFSNDFRNSPDGRAIYNETSAEAKYVVRAMRAAAERWQSLSLEEKAPYVERYKKLRDEWKADQADQ